MAKKSHTIKLSLVFGQMQIKLILKYYLIFINLLYRLTIIRVNVNQLCGRQRGEDCGLRSAQGEKVSETLSQETSGAYGTCL
jgi:hypothetical protein